MKLPVVGLVVDELGQINYLNEGRKLGINLKFINQALATQDLIIFAQECDFLLIDPRIISTTSVRTVERSGVRIYPSSKTLEQLEKIKTAQTTGEYLSILVARSAHAQVASWPITLITNDLTITPLPGISDELLQEIQLSVLKLAGEVGLVGGFELLVDAADYKQLIGINWVTPHAKYWSQIGCVTNFYEQNLRALLDLPLGSTDLLDKFVTTGSLRTDPASDDYRPYLHLMARNPKLKFDQSIKQVGLTSNDLENALTEIIHAQQYYSGEIEE